jgi:DNA-binding response OmpR family regulator
MHKNIKNNVLCLTTSELNNSLSEVKDYLDFNITFSQNLKKDIESSKYSGIIIDADILDQDLTTLLNSIENKIKVLISNTENKHNLFSNKIIDRPFSIVNLNKIILNLITGDKFNKNSSIRIKDYVLDKNEKKLKKNNLFIYVTEKEIQLIELLFISKDPISKKNILKKVWLYSSEADTHTVETHVYRLRKKIQDKFKDDNLIVNVKEGYLI